MTVRSIVTGLVPPFLRPLAARIEASPIGYRLARGAFWSLAGAVISRGLYLASSIIVARFLGREGYGQLGIIQSTVGMFGVFAGFGLGLTATKYVAEFRAKDPAKAGRIMALSALVAVVTGGLMASLLVLLAPWLAANTLAAPQLTGLLRVGALLLFLSALNGAQTGALAGFEAFKAIAKVNLAAGLSAFPLMVGGVYWRGLEGAVWALIASLGVNWLLNHVALRRAAARSGVLFAYVGCRREWKVLWSFSLPALLSGAMVGPVTWACKAMLVNQPNGYAEMGILAAAEQWKGLILFAPALLGQVAVPILSERLGAGDRMRARRTLLVSMFAAAVIAIPAAAVFSLLGGHIMRLYGSEFSPGWPVLVVVVCTAALLAVQAPLGQIIAASGRMWLGLLMNAGWALVLFASVMVVGDTGALRLAFSFLLAYGAHAVWTFGFAHSLTRGAAVMAETRAAHVSHEPLRDWP